MIRTAFVTMLVSGLAASSARADDLHIQGRVIVSVDRLSPLFSYSRIRQDQGNDSTTSSTSSISLLWSGEPTDFYDIPRLGVDYVVARNISIGGNLFATLPMSSTRSQTQNGTTTSRDGAKLNAFGIGVRGGYIMPLAPKVSFWGRGGLSYARVGTTNPPGGNGNDVSNSVSQWGLSLEPLFVISPAPHFGFTIGPVLDIPLSGNQHSEVTVNNMTVSTDTGESQFHFGITVGMLGAW